MDKKGEYLSIFEKYIKRSGADELKNYLLRSDFFKHREYALSLCV